MVKKVSFVLVGIGLAAIIAFSGFGIWRATRQVPAFDAAGYILQGETEEVKSISFRSGEAYTSTLSGGISFSDTDGKKTTVPRESFVYFEDSSVMALSDGVLVDFNDLSDNFINNYYINAGLCLHDSNGSYTAEATAGTMTFGEHLWKLSDTKYLIEAPSLKVYLSEGDVREVKDYVQVVVTADNIVHLLTPDNLWMTISEECYIETDQGVKIYPVSQLIDSGTYKLSLAKLSVTPEDAIVLSELETRRQIVPELNIEAIDGADGQDGTDGQSGQEGASGTAGSAGKNGATGTAGAGGASGEGGANGGHGASGKDAVAVSTTNSALPTMSITEWKVSATGLHGTIKVTDNGQSLEKVGDLGGSTNYPGRVTITEVATGIPVDCYAVDPAFDPSATPGNFNFYTGGTDTPVEFYTKSDALKPDTEYKLSVTAYYAANSQVYSREFIGRVFYTDSTGVHLAYQEATQDSVTLLTSVNADYAASIQKATVYLLTPEQAKTFNMSSFSDTSQYVGKQDVTLSTASRDEKVTFSGLNHNQTYVARVYVETKGGLETLAQQKLEVMTLKRPPEYEKTDKLTVNYNRVSGVFEVFRPTVVDPDGGAVSYTYTAYKKNGTTWENALERTITPGTGEPVEFAMAPGEVYRFEVKMTFNDNEKTVSYDLGRSEEMKSEGDSMPKITLINETSGTDYNMYKGTLRIALSGSKSRIDTTQALKLELSADQIADASVELTKSAPSATVDPNKHVFVLDTTSTNTNYVDVQLDLKDLYKNTNYSITVTGYLDVGDGNGAKKRTIGTVSFHTYDTTKLSATWSTAADATEAAGASIARTLKLAVQDKDAADGSPRRVYAEEQLQHGQVIVELFSGTGTGKLRIAQKNFYEEDKLNALFGSGLTITEKDFGNPPLNSQGSYTLTVSEVADRSYGLQLGYVNTFDDVQNASEVVAAEPTPPDLLADSSRGVKATPIYNSDVAIYGGKQDENLPDEAIVGYALEASYDNVQRIGLNITYYAFEYNSFFNAFKNSKDPVLETKPLLEMTQPIDTGSNFVPKVAVLFGGDAGKDPTLYNGHYVYNAGDPNVLDKVLQSGMGRGFRYIFAYTVEYAGSSTGEASSTRNYPYDHKEYNDYLRVHGGITEHGVSVGRNVAYILNSGMCEAPLILPDFHTYVFNSTQDALTQDAATTATGTVELHYKWRDPDQLIIKDGTANNTTISYEKGAGTVSQNIQANPVGSGDWYRLNMDYAVSKGTAAYLMPAVNICAYRLNYDSVLQAFNLTADNKSLSIGAIPLEWSWEQQFKRAGYQKIQVQMDLKHLADNYIAFRFNMSDPATDKLLSRGIGLELTITPDGGEAKNFRLPLVSDVDGTYAKLATGLLGEGFLNKSFEVNRAVLLYDTGIQGWSILEDADNRKSFALQYVENTDTEFGFTNYIGATSLSGVPANGALLATPDAFTVYKLQDTIKEKPEDDTKLALITTNPFLKNSGSSGRYLYPDRYGVDAHNSTMLSQLSGKYLTPKKVAAYELKFPAGGNSGTLDQMTPTIDKPYFATTSGMIKMEGIKIYGLEGGGTIYAAAFNSRDDAEKLTVPRAAEVEIPINASGVPTGVDPQLIGLDGGKQYYVAFYYVVDGKAHLLLTADTALPAVYEVSTSTQAVIKLLEQEYQNNGYFDKKEVIKYSISRRFGLKMSYDIYGSADDASKKQNVILPYAEMTPADETAILQAPVDPNPENQITIDLKPRAAREKLKPGTTYYLRITAFEERVSGEGVTREDAGYLVVPFTLTAVGNYDALIYVSNATSNSISFLVTINDPQYTLMGRDTGAGSYEGALYAVRFTDKDGKRLHTKYDREVYTANQLRKGFVLNDSCLERTGIMTNESIKADATYQLRIYAVPDADHNGTIKLGGTDMDWTKFFQKGGAMKDCGKEFLQIVDGFWNTDTTSTNDPDEAQLLIASKSQQTTNTQGWILNEKGVYSVRFDPTTVRIMFQESVGLLGADPGTGAGAEPVFRRIDWSLKGMAGDGTPVSASGTSRLTQGDKLLQSGTGGGHYDMYYFDIPYQVGQGSYTIVLQFRETEQQPSASKTITIYSGV